MLSSGKVPPLSFPVGNVRVEERIRDADEPSKLSAKCSRRIGKGVGGLEELSRMAVGVTALVELEFGT
ncbi:uncharacterized protein N7446_001203 [Penicillium canescens]|uniref:Uncharacterized protein n=1 Tax=Penicillium canescens TaxID=5083 RepID=A0AAD6ICN6_PENCN|nr:uncharacterized protein N7446_001203 [Penicillium canescens]KAJ6043007.1 hypothetical protein N7460_004362 [Penicillium canescens]KAJ6054481.1 hypothetical protein N7444_003579 [Penicillium canescens]KAJ6073426.1 hypothetical protein N7446_001203 [Penicillium canescens]